MVNDKIILLSNADYLGTLDAARGLGKIGVKVVIADPKKWRVSNWSKYTTYIKSPYLSDTKNFLGFLKGQAKNGVFTTALPTSDTFVWYLASRYKELSKYFEIPNFKPSVMKLVLFKNLIYPYCEKHRISVPKTYFPTSYIDVRKIAKKVDYPAIIKHSMSVGINSGRKGVVVFSEHELINKYKKDEIAYDRKIILKEVPHAEWPMIQEYIPNALNNIYDLKGISVNNANFISIMCAKKLRQEPPKLGVSVCTMPVSNPQATEAVIKLLKTLKYEGVFGVEVLYDQRDNKCKIIDFNPRITGSFGVSTGNGFDIPKLWYDHVCGKNNVKNEVFVGNAVLIHLISDILYMPGNLIHSKNKILFFKELFKSYTGPKKFAVLSIDDPKPFVIDVIMTLRRRIKHPFFYLREIIKGE